MDLLPKEYKKGGDIISPAALNSNSSVQPLPKAPLSGVKAGKINLPGRSSRGFDYLKFGIIAGVVLLILSVALWGGLKLYQRTLNANIENLKEQEAAVFSAQDKEMAEKIAGLKKRADLAETFLKSHIYTSEILTSIAAFTLPKVKWDTYDLSVKEQSVALKGQAADYSVLAKQIFTFEQTDYSNIAVSDISLSKTGTVSFSIKFNFNPKILQKP